MKYEVTVIVNKKLRGFALYDEDMWIKRNYVTAKDIDEVISIVNKRHNIKDMTCTEIFEDENYATYKSNVDGIEYCVDIDQ